MSATKEVKEPVQDQKAIVSENPVMNATPMTVVDQLNNVIKKIEDNLPTDEGTKRDCLISAKSHIEAAIYKINKSKE